MGKDFKVISKSGGGADIVGSTVNLMSGLAFVDMLTGNDPIMRDSYTYVIEDKDGNRHTVHANNSEELGEKISKGDFDDD